MQLTSSSAMMAVPAAAGHHRRFPPLPLLLWCVLVTQQVTAGKLADRQCDTSKCQQLISRCVLGCPNQQYVDHFVLCCAAVGGGVRPQDDCLLSTCVSDTVSISLPTHQQLVAALRASVLEVAPLLHCATLPPAHIGNFVEHHSHRAQVRFMASRSVAAVMTAGDMSCQLYLLPVRIPGQHKPVVHKAQCQGHASAHFN